MKPTISNLSRIFQASVWFCFGLFGKIIPAHGRHQQILEDILHISNANTLIVFIGLLELALSLWILTIKNVKHLVPFQVMLILFMNLLELKFAPEHLLFGRFNILFAIAYSYLIIYLEYFHNKVKSRWSIH